MELHREFKTFEEFEAARKQWEKDTHQSFTTSRSKKFRIGDEARETLVYTEIVFSCLHGKERPSEASGVRPFQHTKKMGCPVTFQLNGSKRSGTLVVRVAPDIAQHNHQLTESTWLHETPNRLLTVEEEQTVKDLLTKNVPVSQITKVVAAETKKPIRPKDIHNLRDRLEEKTKRSGDSVQQLLQGITEDMPGTHVNVTMLDTSSTQCIVVVTPDMKRNYTRSPVVLFIDATYKVNKENYAMYVLMVQDATGLAQVSRSMVFNSSNLTVDYFCRLLESLGSHLKRK